jgi:hypothetical protein
MISEQSKIIAYISRLNRELQEFAGCPGSLDSFDLGVDATSSTECLLRGVGSLDS